MSYISKGNPIYIDRLKFSFWILLSPFKTMLSYSQKGPSLFIDDL